MASENRIIELDLLRVMAIFLVILQHSWSMLGLDSAADGMQYHFYRFAIIGVPLFVMISGSLLLRKEMPVKLFLKKRFTRILLPFVFWTTIVYVISCFLGRYDDVHNLKEALLCYVPYFFGNKINSVYWFMFMLIGLYLLTPLFQRAFSAPASRNVLKYVICLWFIWQLLCLITPEFILVRYYRFSAYLYVGYFLVGFYIIQYLPNKRLNRLLGGIGFCVTYALNVVLSMQGWKVTPIEVLEVLCLFLFFVSIDYRLPHWLQVGIVQISRYSFAIYLSHVMVIGLLYHLGIQHYLPLAVVPLVTSVVVFVFCSYYCFVLDKCRFIPNKLIGI